MAVYQVSVNLSSSLYPFASQMWGRTVMVPGPDENYNRTIFSTVDPGFEKQSPQVFYMHNIMPMVQGYQSVGYDLQIDNSGNFTSPPDNPFDNAYQIQTPTLNNFLYVSALGANYVYDATVGHWVSTSAFAPGTINSGTSVTTALVQGQTYIYFSQVGCYVYDDVGKVLVPTTLTGLDPTQILGITGANGYLIAVSASAVAWSSLVDPTDFTPSLITGAGGGNINDAKGPVVTVLQITGGFVIYCEFNAVGATYTGNSSFPFIFLEIAGSGGLISTEHVSYHSNSAAHYALTTFGLQELTKNSAKSVYPEVTDFLAAKIYEDFDETSLLLSSSYTDAQLTKKIHLIESRYLVISYALTGADFTFAVIYDLTLKRWGKVKVTHVDCFEWNAPNVYGQTTYGDLAATTYGDLSATTYGDLDTSGQSVTFPRKHIAFLQRNGNVLLLNFDLAETAGGGVFIIGKFQLRRRNWISHQSGTVDSVNASPSFGDAVPFDYYISPTFDGKTLQPFQSARMNEKLSGPKVRTYQRYVTGVNVTIALIGQFAASSLVMDFTAAGNR